MKFVVRKDFFITRVQSVLRAVSSRTTIPILSCIKITASTDGLTLTGSDSNMSIQAFTPADDESLQIFDPGGIALQARVFYEILKNLPDGDIHFEVENVKAVIHSGKSEFKMNGIKADEYPRLPTIENGQKLSLSALLIKDLIRQTVFAVSTSETRPVLTGVNWQLSEGQLTCSATDSHLLALRKVEIDSDQSFNVVIPGKSLQELQSLLPDDEELIDIFVSSNQILFSLPHLDFYTRLLEGAYPDITRFISNDSKAQMSVNTLHFSQVIKRALLLAKEGSHNVIKFISTANGDVQVISHSPEFGELIEEVEVNSMEGEETHISFNAKYMADAIKAHDSSDIHVRFTGAMRPITITSPEDDSILQLIVPVRSY